MSYFEEEYEIKSDFINSQTELHLRNWLKKKT